MADDPWAGFDEVTPGGGGDDPWSAFESAAINPPRPRVTPAPTPAPDGVDPWASAGFEDAGAPVESDEPGLLSQTFETLSMPFTLSKRLVDYGARGVAALEGIPQAPGTTTGQMVRNALSLGREQVQAEHPGSYWRPILGRASEFGGDLASDPLFAAAVVGSGGGAGLLGTGALAAEDAALLANLGKAAAAAFTPGMVLGAASEGSRAVHHYGKEGFSPRVAEEAFGALLSAYMAKQSYGHGFGGPKGPAAPVPEPRAWETPTAETVLPDPVHVDGEHFGPYEVSPITRKFAETQLIQDAAEANAPTGLDMLKRLSEQHHDIEGTDQLGQLAGENIGTVGAPRLRPRPVEPPTPVEGLGTEFNLSPEARALLRLQEPGVPIPDAPPPRDVNAAVAERLRAAAPRGLERTFEDVRQEQPFDVASLGDVAKTSPRTPGQQLAAAVDRATAIRQAGGVEKAGFDNLDPAMQAEVRKAADSWARVILQREKAEPTGPIPIRRDGRIEGWVGVRSKKAGTPFEQLPYGPTQMVKAMDQMAKTGRPNRIAMEMIDSVLKHDPDLQTHLERGFTDERATDRRSDTAFTRRETAAPVAEELRATGTEDGRRVALDRRGAGVVDLAQAREELAAAAEPTTEAAPQAKPPAPAKPSLEEVVRKRIAAETALRRSFVQERGETSFQAPARGGWDVTVTPSTRTPGSWQLTRLEGGEPIGHTEHASFSDAVEFAQHEYGADMTRAQTERATPTRRAQDVPVENEQRVEERTERRRSELDRIIRETHPDKLKEEHPETYEAIYVDPLTALGNRRLYERLLPDHKGPVMSLDLGGLGFVNDKLGGGHPLGDAFLKSFADVARRVKERYGVDIMRAGAKSDEFIGMGADDATAAEAMRYMQEEFANAEFTGLINGEPVTFSGGRVDYGIARSESAPSAAERLRVGDQELYAAREAAADAGLRTRVKGGRPPGLRQVRPEPGPGIVSDKVPAPAGGREEVVETQPATAPAESPTTTAASRAALEDILNGKGGGTTGGGGTGGPSSGGGGVTTGGTTGGGGGTAGPLPPAPPANGTAGAPVNPGASTRQSINAWHRFALPWLENVEKIPVLGKQIADVVRAGKREWETNASRQAHEYLKIVRGLSKDEWKDTQASLEGAAPTSKKVAAATDSIRLILDDVAKRADAAGVFIDYTKDYFPRWSKDGRWSFEKMVEERAAQKPGGLTRDNIEEAAAELHEARRRGEFTLERKVSSLERQRTGQLKDYRTDKGVLVDYVVEANRRIAEANQYGPRLEKLMQLAQRIPNQADNRYVRVGVERMTGREGQLPGAKFAGKVRGIEAATKLATGPISQLGSIVQTVWEGGARNTAKGLFDSIFKYGDSELEAIRSGAAFPNIGGEAQALTGGGVKGGLIDKLPHLQATQFVDKFMRVVADRTAEKLIPDLHAKAAAGDVRSARALKLLGIDAAKPLTDAVMLEGRKNFSERTQFRTDLTETPLWATTPTGRVLTQFMHFAYQQGRFLSRAAREAARGDGKPLGRYISTMIAAGLVGEIGNDAKAVLKGYGAQGDDADSIAAALTSRRARFDLNNPKSALTRMLQNMLFSGFGIYQTAIERYARSQDPVDLIGGPTVGDVYALSKKGLPSLLHAVTGDKEALGKDVQGVKQELVRRSVPLLGGQLEDEFMRTQNEIDEKGDRPATPGWVGRIRDVNAGETTGKEAFLRGVGEGGPGSPTREKFKRLEDAREVKRQAEARLKERAPGVFEKEKKTVEEKTANLEKGARRDELVAEILDLLEQGKKQQAYNIAARAKREGISFTRGQIRDLEAYVRNKKKE